MTTFKRNNGQFVPISGIVMFTMVVMMLALVNVYTISRAKLKVQNLADAAALNLATQQAQAFNVVTDRNEWLNHMMAGIPSPSDSSQPGVGDCKAFTAANQKLLPGISCIENSYGANSSQVKSRHIFNNQQGAANYASVVQTVNEAQKLFVAAYNSFLGDRSRAARSSAVGAGPSNFAGLLKNDIPELNDPSISLIAWDSPGGEPSTDQIQDLTPGIQPRMQGLRFKPHHDIETAYYMKRCALGICIANAVVVKTTLGKLMFGKNSTEAVGWMVPDWQNSPKISVQTGAGGPSEQVGVGVLVKKTVALPVIGSVAVSAKSKAYLVRQSGNSGDSSGIPRFKPTYWAKLGS